MHHLNQVIWNQAPWTTMDEHWKILKQLFLKLRGWCGDVYWQSYDFAIDNWKKVITHCYEKNG